MMLMLALLITSLILVLIARIVSLSRKCSELHIRIDKSCAELGKMQRDFESQVLARTAAIKKVNEDFQYEIQQRIKSEEQLVCQKELFQFVVSTAPFIVWAFDSNGIFLLSEGKGLEALGLQPGEVVGKSVFEVYKDEPEILDCSRRALTGELVKAFVKASDRRFDSWFIPVLDSQRMVTRVVGFAIDTGKASEE
ncbi:MAG: PAS domain-containing protein [Nitrospirae bacterium]|nr:PAS domain-containing protein [Nitrospirota bacterium]